MNMDDKVIITKEEYEQLKNDRKFLDALYAFGVDNWEGYQEAVESVEE